MKVSGTSSMQTAMQRLKKMQTSGPEGAIREECLSMAENINEAVILFVSGVYTVKVRLKLQAFFRIISC